MFKDLSVVYVTDEQRWLYREASIKISNISQDLPSSAKCDDLKKRDLGLWKDRVKRFFENFYDKEKKKKISRAEKYLFALVRISSESHIFM